MTNSGAASGASSKAGPLPIILDIGPPGNGGVTITQKNGGEPTPAAPALVERPKVEAASWGVLDAVTPGSWQNFKALMPAPLVLATGERPVSDMILVAQPGTEGTQPPAPAPTPNGAIGRFDHRLALGGAESAAGATAPAAATSTVSGQSALASTGVGDLLGNSASAQGVEIQRRSPLVGDPRIEGMHFGQIVTQADGGYWFPARVDLDSVVSKLNTSDIHNISIIKGPFSDRYGPGFSFLDIESVPTPRSTTGCFDAHGSSSLNYRTNGDGWQGQQSVWGGNTDWGFRLTYDINAAGDYSTGNGTKMPSSYNNQFVNFAFGWICCAIQPGSALSARAAEQCAVSRPVDGCQRVAPAMRLRLVTPPRTVHGTIASRSTRGSTPPRSTAIAPTPRRGADSAVE